MVVTLSGILIDVKLVEPEKALLPIVVTLVGIATEPNCVQP